MSNKTVLPGSKILLEGQQELSKKDEEYKKHITDIIDDPNITGPQIIYLIELFCAIKHKSPLTQAIARILKPVPSRARKGARYRKGEIATAMNINDGWPKGRKSKTYWTTNLIDLFIEYGLDQSEAITKVSELHELSHEAVERNYHRHKKQ